MAGGSYQGMFRNPLVSPDILGATAGAGFGAALGIMLAKSIIMTELLVWALALPRCFSPTPWPDGFAGEIQRFFSS